MARGFLSKTFINSMQGLAVGHHWRSRFEDQLNISYKDWLLKKVSDEFTKATKVDQFLGGAQSILGEQLTAVERTKDPIKKSMALTAAVRERVR